MKPLLSGKFDITTCNFPVIVSPKIDGVRCLILSGRVMSRNLKPLPNKYLQSLLGCYDLNNLDGEIVVGSPMDKYCFNKTTKFVMSKNAISEFTYLVFDDFTHTSKGFTSRLRSAVDRIAIYKQDKSGFYIEVIPHLYIDSKVQLESYHSKNIQNGYEGTMIRSPFGTYKYGRSTTKEGILLKWKPYQDSEARVVGFEELLTNENEPTTNALGYAIRSSHKENKVFANTLGALIVEDLYSGIRFKIGTGLSDVDRNLIWNDRYKFIDKTLKYKYNETVKDKPRHPVFLYWI